MRSFALFTLSLVGAAAAETVTSLFLPDFDPQPLVGSVMDHSGSTTTILIDCRPGTDGNDCGVPLGGFIVTQAPDAIQFDVGNKGSSFYMTVSCDLRNTESVTCVEIASGDDANFPGSSTEVFTDISTNYLPVTITADATATSGSGSASTSASAHSTSTAAATTTSSTLLVGTHTSPTSQASKTTSAASTGSATAASTSLSSSSSTGGAPQATGAIQWVACGAAALVLAAL